MPDKTTAGGPKGSAQPGGPPHQGRRGVTLVEMLVVVMIIGSMAAVAFPTISAGLDSVRLASASDTIVSFLNAALNRAERRQQAVEVEISKKDNTLRMRSEEPGFERSATLPDGVTIQAVLPPLPVEEEGPRRFILLPGGTPPRIAIELAGQKGAHRIVRVDPITGVPVVERIEAPTGK